MLNIRKPNSLKTSKQSIVQGFLLFSIATIAITLGLIVAFYTIRAYKMNYIKHDTSSIIGLGTVIGLIICLVISSLIGTCYGAKYIEAGLSYIHQQVGTTFGGVELQVTQSDIESSTEESVYSSGDNRDISLSANEAGQENESLLYR